jgi:hypothetical protein
MTAIPCVWSGEAFLPARGFQKRADQFFVVGERYIMEPVEERSAASHRAFFATVNEAWSNLKDSDAERFPTATHLRKFALIKCGFADERQIVCRSAAEATRLSAFIAPMDAYALVVARGPVVTVWTARSQSMRAMGKDEFLRSQAAVRELIATMIKVKPDELERAGEAA